ncbi:tol-pal system protein YbgF, partial [Salmonella enterica subsp. enterica serovar Newport str. WA_14900]
GAPVQSGDANTDYNAAIALVQDKSRQDDAIVAFQNFIKKYPDSLISRTPIIGWAS